MSSVSGRGRPGTSSASARVATMGTSDPGIHSAVVAPGERRVEDRDHLVAAVAEHAERGLAGVGTEVALGEDHQPARRLGSHRSSRRAPSGGARRDGRTEKGTPPGRGPGASDRSAGTAYRIRTGDLRLERAASWASRRMRPVIAAVALDRRGGYQRPAQQRQPSAAAAPRPPLQAVRLEERPHPVGHLAVPLLREHQAVVRRGPELLVLGAQPVGEPLRGRARRGHPRPPSR